MTYASLALGKAWVLTIKDRWFYCHFGIDSVAVERAEPTIYCEVQGGLWERLRHSLDSPRPRSAEWCKLEGNELGGKGE